MREAYSKAIDILMGGDVDYKAIAITLAKTCPEVFVEIASKRSAFCQPDDLLEHFNNEIRSMMHKNQKVDAIRYCRTQTGMGLKEAKDYCEDIYDSRPVKTPGRFKVASSPSDTSSAEALRALMAKSLAASVDTAIERTGRYKDEGEFQ